MKYGITGQFIHKATSLVGVETHGHYLVLGGGLSDHWKAGHDTNFSGCIFLETTGGEERL